MADLENPICGVGLVGKLGLLELQGVLLKHAVHHVTLSPAKLVPVPAIHCLHLLLCPRLLFDQFATLRLRRRMIHPSVDLDHLLLATCKSKVGL